MIEHMSRNEALRAIKEMVRVLKPGGKILIHAAGPFSISGGVWGEDTRFTRHDLEVFAKKANLSKYRAVRGDNYQPFAHFNFDALDVVSTAKENAVLLIGEK
jgi:SAM-dependent methyltransferase